MSSHRSSDPDISLELGPRYYAALFPFGKAVASRRWKKPEYETEYISREVLGAEEGLEEELTFWSEWDILEEDVRKDHDLDTTYTVYRLENDPKARELAVDVYKTVQDSYNGKIFDYLEEDRFKA